MKINALYASGDIKCIDLNHIVANNINNIHAIYIDFGLLLGEFVSRGVIALGEKSGEDFLELLKDTVHLYFIHVKDSISSPELITDITEEYIVDKHQDSFLCKAYYYSIPVFLSDIHFINETMIDYRDPVIDGAIDLFMYKYINAQYDVNKYMIGKESNKTMIQSILSSSVFRKNEQRIVDIDYKIPEVEGVKYLYDELMEQV